MQQRTVTALKSESPCLILAPESVSLASLGDSHASESCFFRCCRWAAGGRGEDRRAGGGPLEGRRQEQKELRRPRDHAGGLRLPAAP